MSSFCYQNPKLMSMMREQWWRWKWQIEVQGKNKWQQCKSQKMCNALWMGHGWVLHGAGCMAPKHKIWNFTCFSGRYVSRFRVPLKLLLGCPLKLDMFCWVVGFGCLPTWALKLAVVGNESCHVSVDVMFWGMLLLGVKIGTKLP